MTFRWPACWAQPAPPSIYILSTTVIQGIVPNAELVESNGPFGLAFAKMFSPAVGSIVMVLAVLACLGSLLGWQFTLAQTGKAAADERMFPAVFSQENSMGAPIVGMVIMGVVQSLMALMTISPNLNEQFSALVNLAVVTNVVPVHHRALCVARDDEGRQSRATRNTGAPWRWPWWRCSTASTHSSRPARMPCSAACWSWGSASSSGASSRIASHRGDRRPSRGLSR